jgi:hypothetical protein
MSAVLMTARSRQFWGSRTLSQVHTKRMLKHPTASTHTQRGTCLIVSCKAFAVGDFALVAKGSVGAHWPLVTWL